ncbi:MAG: O-antigen ligase family protein [Planctomycetaceae bacterium]
MVRSPGSDASSVAPPLAERVAVGLLCLAAVVGPLLLGSTGPWPRFGLEATMALAATLWAVSGPRDWRLLVVPLAVAGLFLLQLVPLPDGLLVSLAPVSAGRWKAGLEGLEPRWGTVSVTPTATAAGIGRLLLGAATIAAVTSLARTAAYRRWFYTALATSAALVWVSAIACPVNPDNRAVMGFFSLRGPLDFWRSPERGPLQTAGCGYFDWVTVGTQRYQADGAISGDGFGTYIYSNHYANALCLTLPALWAMWMMLSARRKVPTAARFAVLLASMALACWTTGAMAQSRAGTASLAFAAILYLALIAQNRWLRWPTAGLAAAIALGLVGFVATFQGPLSGLLGLLPGSLHAKIAAVLADGRLVAAQVAGRMFLASPLLGTGLGTYGDLYPGILRSDRNMYFAHNEYAQMLAESGLLGVAILLAMAWVLGSRFWRFCRERPAASRQIDAGAWAAVAGVAAHSVFDWGLHAPANALLACLVAGLALSSVAVRKPTEDRGAFGRGIALAFALAFALACLVALPLLARAAATDTTLDALRRATTAARVALAKPDAPPAEPLLTAAIARGTRASRLDPANWQLAALLGHANLHLAQVSRDAGGRDAADRAAAEWFRAARRSSAATRGLPEPLPPQPK